MTQSAPRLAPARPGGRGPETRERLLDAAEQLIAQHGFEGASLRAVTRAAGASVSAANYHFGSKEALVVATLRRRVDAINGARFALLDRALQAECPELEAVVDAFLRPGVEFATGSEQAQFARRLSARVLAEPPSAMRSLRRELFDEVRVRFEAALAECLPDAPPETARLGLGLMVGMVVHLTSGPLADEDWPVDTDEIATRCVRFAVAGLRAIAGEGTR